MSPGPACEVSVVIPTYQRREAVERVLRALEAQTLPASAFEVIVSIDGSDDGTRELVERLVTPYRLHALWQPNHGRAAACNAGIAAARGPLVVLLDDDMVPSPGLLEAHRRAHPKGSRLAVVGAAPVVLDASAPPVAAYIREKFERHLERLSAPAFDFKLRDFYSGNCSIRRGVLLEVGGFDEDFTIYGNEDLELSLRLRQAGVCLVYDREACAGQRYVKSFAELARDTIAKGRTARLLARKHPDTFPDLQLSRYRDGSWKWRALRAVLLRLGDLWPGTPDRVARMIAWLERSRPVRLHRYYTLSLDYYYWVGARDSVGARAETAPGRDGGRP